MGGGKGSVSADHISVMQVLWGHMSANSCRDLMEKFAEDLKRCKDGVLDMDPINALVKMGTNGKHPQHVWRDMKRSFLPTPLIPVRYHLMPFSHAALGSFFRTMPHSIIDGSLIHPTSRAHRHLFEINL